MAAHLGRILLASHAPWSNGVQKALARHLAALRRRRPIVSARPQSYLRLMYILFAGL